MTFTLKLNLSAITRQVEKAAGKAVRVGAEHVLTEANQHVPHDEGTLERSGSVDSDGTTAAVSYDTPYAARQHEDLALHHHGKGQAKWLENALTGERSKVAKVEAAAMRAELGT